MSTHDYYEFEEHEPMPEGEEEAPPLVRTMATVRWVLLGGMTLFALVMVLSYFGLTPWAAQGGAGAQYHCPMHPTYITSQPGDCPICGMSLVPIASSGADSSADTSPAASETEYNPAPGQYYCPMKCAGSISDEPGRCPVCNMHLKQMLMADSTYACPMHPDVQSDDPGTCPECGMDLVLKDASDIHSGHDAGMGEAPVEGLVPVTIEARRLQLIGIRTTKAAERPADGALRFVGFVTPDETRVANLHVRTDGWVQDLYINETGQLVEKGELLLSLYSQDLYQAQQDFIVARDASKRSAGDTLVDTMRRQLVEAARERLRLLGLPDAEMESLEHSDLASQILPLRSPFAGYVLEKSVYPGQYITPNQNLLTITSLDRVWVIVDVYERDLPYIRKGQRVTLTAPSLPGHTLDGTIDFIYPSVTQSTRTIRVRLEFDNPGLRLRPGMYVDVSVSREGPPMLAVPASAVMDGGEVQYVFVVHDGTHFEPRRVGVGRRSDDWIEIVKGLRAGEEVVTSANFLIDSESRLQAAISGMGTDTESTTAGHTH